jgi:hypothetical protein
MIKRASLFFTAFTISIIIGSCSKNQDSSCATCGVKTPDALVTLNFGSVSLPFNNYTDLSVSDFSDRGDLFLAKNSLTPAELSDIAASLGLNIAPNKDSYELVNLALITRKSKWDADVVSRDDVVGVLAYYGNASNIFCFPYKVTSSGKESIEALNHRVGAVFTQDFVAFARLLSFMQSPFNDLGIISIRGKLNPNVKGGLPYHYLIHQYIRNNEQQFVRKTMGPSVPSDPENCGNGCPNAADSRCDAMAEPPQCLPICTANEMKKTIENNDIHYSLVHSEIYDFRDDFLKKSEKGIRYVERYYFFGSYLVENMSLDLALDAMATYQNCAKPIMTSLMQNPTSTAPLMTNYQKDELLELITSIRSISNDSIYHAELDILVKDIQYYSSKSVLETNADFN